MTDSTPKLYSERQIALIRESGRIVARALAIAKSMAVPGATTSDIERVSAEFLAKSGAISPFKGYELTGKPPFPTVLCASVNSVVVHGLPDETPLKEGDLVSIDIGAKKEYYIGDSAWTFAVGNPNTAARRLLACGENALYAGIRAAQRGAKLADIARAVQSIAEGEGYSVVRDLCGHGVGQSLHEPPQVRNYVDPADRQASIVLKPGMVIAIEPMINEGKAAVVMGSEWPVRTKDGSRSVHFEHTVAITSTGPAVLTI